MSMKYYAQMNRRVRDVHVYTIVKRVGGNQNFLTEAFVKLFSGMAKKGREGANATERLS